MGDVHVITPGAERFRLDSAILIYRAREQIYATAHSIRNGKGGPSIGPGNPVTTEQAAQFAREFEVQTGYSGFLAPEILYTGARVTAWWRAPKPACVHFDARNEKDPKRDLGQVTAVTPQPGLVFALAGEHWFVFAVRGADRPGPGTRIHRTPYFNVWKDGRICEGNLSRPATVSAESLSAFERAFFESRFTHVNVQKGSDIARFNGGPYALWRDLLAGRWKSYPEATLVSMNTTLAQTLKKLEAAK